jgi:DNA-directed RNA polymerase subunit H (RpoH/RPB5)
MEIETALRNLATMLKHRGVDVSALEALNTADKLSDFYTSTVTVSCPMADEGKDARPITVFFCLTRELMKEQLALLKGVDNTPTGVNIDKLIGEFDGSNKFIAVYKPLDKQPTQTNMLAAFDERDKALQAKQGYFQVFKIQTLMYDPAAHIYVPKHEKMTEVEIKKLLELYQLKNRFHLPNILRTDVMARYLGLNHGDVVKIDRYNDTAGTYTYYRCCVKA